MEVIMKYKWYMLGLLFVISILVYYIYFNNDIEYIEKNIFAEKNDDEVKIEYIYVDIKGEIANSGVKKILNGSRVIDLIIEAGGLLKTADTSNINLSKVLVDEDVIVINSITEIKEIIDSDASINLNNNLISINNASISELETIPGIGPSKAGEIINYRKTNPFKKLEDIKNVKGIGEATFDKIKAYITL